MNAPGLPAVRAAFEGAFQAAVAAVDPVRLTAEAIRRHGPWSGPVTLIALGKAAPGMARGALDALPRPPVRAVGVSDRPGGVEGVEWHVGGHPFPDGRSLVAGTALRDAAAGCHGTLLVLVSGGGSALAEVPAPGLSLDDLVTAHRAVMHAGAPIEDLNLVRRHLSLIKDGGLAAAAPARRIVTLVISDVVDAGPEDVASGPTLAGAGSPADAADVITRLGLAHRLPGAVLDGLRTTRGRRVDRPHDVEVVADGSTAATAAVDRLRRVGFAAGIDPRRLRGEARTTALRFLEAAPEGRCTVAWGETTVTVTGAGIGGRNQEGALAAALALRDTEGVFGALGTDGVDGPTDAAGAIVDGRTVDRIVAAGLDPAARLEDNDAHPALEAAGDLVRTGPTGTNVADVWIVRPRSAPAPGTART